MAFECVSQADWTWKYNRNCDPWPVTRRTHMTSHRIGTQRSASRKELPAGSDDAMLGLHRSQLHKTCVHVCAHAPPTQLPAPRNTDHVH